MATKGRDSSHGYIQWVSSYKLAYSLAEGSFVYVQLSTGDEKIFVGSFDSDTVIEHCLDDIQADKVRMYPVSWYGSCVVLWEVYAVIV